MILKKPYAFLIKNFKLIHILLMLLIIFFSTKYSKIVSFFTGYVNGSTSVSENAASIFISPILFYLLAIILVFSILMYLLMTKKNKPNKLYLFIVLYYIVLLFSIIHAGNMIDSLADTTLSQQTSRAYRDIYLIFSFPNYFFILLCLIRGIGFDVKKFNFGKDLEELQIKSEDNEEFEFVLGNDNYKAKRKIRRYIREFKYYIIENKFIFSILITILIIGILITVGLKVFVTDVSYKIGDTTSANIFTYTLNNAYETELNYNGNKIKQDKKYIILDMSITNNSSTQSLKSEYMYLLYGKEKIYYKTSNQNNFSDLGVVYTNKEIKTGKTANNLILFEVPKNVNEKKCILYLFDYTQTTKKGEEYIYKKFVFIPQKLDKELEPKEQKLNTEFSLGSELFGNSTFTITSSRITGSFAYKYQECKNKNSCEEKTDVEIAEDPLNKKLLILEYKLVKDPKSLYLKNNSTSSLFNKYMNISYGNDEKLTEISANARINDKIKNTIILEVPQSIEYYKNINLIYKTRYNKYFIKLK